MSVVADAEAEPCVQLEVVATDDGPAVLESQMTYKISVETARNIGKDLGELLETCFGAARAR